MRWASLPGHVKVADPSSEIPKAPPKKRRQEETKSSISFVKAVRDLPDHPQKHYLIHIPNGGFRTKTEAKIFKAMGVSSGFPDYFVFYKPFLAIEIKTDDGVSSADQIAWRERLEAQDIAYHVCRSPGEALTIYLDFIRPTVSWLT